MNTPADQLHIDCETEAFLNKLQFSILPLRIRLKIPNSIDRRTLRVVVRTNLNQARRIRRQIIDRVERGQSYSTDYYDVAATYRPAEQAYGVDILLSEVGYFEYKVRVESTRKDDPWVKWSEGPNRGVSVTPLPYGRDNSIYCAFLRQFGANKHKAELVNPTLEEAVRRLEEKGAYVLPPGGNFANFIEELPFIVNELGMKIIHLLPINPVPTSYGRMGMYGSPYATTDFFGIDHTYASFSRYKTIEDQFIDLTSTIHGLGARVFLDMVVNHTGWASSIHFTHQHWRKVDENRQIVSPGAWGVVWGDLVELDYRHTDLWEYMARVFLCWCHRGIDGFRLDAGYMVPMEVWQYIISKVREEFPNTLFLLEGLGGPWETTEKLITQGQMNWAYSELFQNYSKEQIRHYLDYAQKVSSGKGVLVHYAETHDNDRLAKKGKAYARMRLYVSALMSFSGAWGFTNGVEWLATEKIDVHRNTGLNWGCEENLVADIARINRILKENPAFWQHDNIVVADLGHKDLLAFTRQSADGSNVIAAIINLNTESEWAYRWDLKQTEGAVRLDGKLGMLDLFSDELRETPDDLVLAGRCGPCGCVLYRLNEPQEVKPPAVAALFDVDYDRITLIYQILLQRFRPYEVGRIEQEMLLRQVTDFRKFIALVQTSTISSLYKNDIGQLLANIDQDMVEKYSSVWTLRDSSKEYIIPGDKWLVAHTFVPCTAYLKTPQRTVAMESIPDQEGLGHLSFFPPQPQNIQAMLAFYWKLKRQNMIQRQWQEQEYPIRSIPSSQIKTAAAKRYPIELQKEPLHQSQAKVFLANSIGGFCQVPAMPAQITSKYDTFFSLTLDPHLPTQRTSLVKMVKETIQVGRKFFDLDESFFVKLKRYPHPVWEFAYDDGEYRMRLQRSLVFAHGQDTLTVRYKVLETNHRLILTSKFYLENRGIHDQLTATDALRSAYPEAVKTLSAGPGICFDPQPGVKLFITAKAGEYVEQPQWIYGLRFSEETQRGLRDQSDAFAPGVFNCELHVGDSQTLCLTTDPDTAMRFSHQKNEQAENKRVKELLAGMSLPQFRKDSYVRMLLCALDQFIHKVNGSWHLVSGYPWLGQNTRESLRSVGGLLAAGREKVAADIILGAARTEENGMISDWLIGGPDSRICVESSLQLVRAAYNYVAHTGDGDFWANAIDRRRSLRDVLGSIYRKFTQNQGKGVRLDERSGLLYCPAGATWMNTTEPQATPRGGYPIEIQALWYDALWVLQKIDPLEMEKILTLRHAIAECVGRLYFCQPQHYLADLLSCDGGFVPATEAKRDSALRFNQLEAIHTDLVSPDQSRHLLQAVGRQLLIPGGLRSLSEDLLEQPMRVVSPTGQLLANPDMPYQGRCVGDETARRLAYHNGTGWSWAYLSYVEAEAKLDGFSSAARQQGLAYFEPIWAHLESGGIASLAEMLDGNYPHTHRGCFAHALTVAETLRVYLLLQCENPPITREKTEPLAAVPVS